MALGLEIERLRFVPSLMLLSICCAGCVRTRIAEIPAAPGPGSAPAAIFSVDGRPNYISRCRSGDREYFRGVDLVSESDGATLRVLVDPLDGLHLKLLWAQGGSRESVFFTVADCRELRAVVQPTGWRVNHVRDFTGELQAQCVSASGVELQARVSFSHCH